MTVAESIDAPITLEHHTFVEYAFNHWLDSLKKGTPPKTLCLLGPPGIGKSSAAYDLQRRMTDYVRAHPEIIFGDEPTGNLDAANRDRIMDALFQYSADAGAALLVVTHDGELPPRFDRVIDIREAAE